jgi:hypothetical protein
MVQCAKESGQIVNDKAGSVARQKTFFKFTELPPFAVGHDSKNRRFIISVKFLNGDEFRQALRPPDFKIVFLGFDNAPSSGLARTVLPSGDLVAIK